jgi:hypothetical protein
VVDRLWWAKKAVRRGKWGCFGGLNELGYGPTEIEAFLFPIFLIPYIHTIQI